MASALGLNLDFTQFDWQLWLSPLLFLLGGLALGWVLERTLIAATRKVLSKTSLDLNKQVVKVMRGVVMAFFILGGLYLATYTLPNASEKSMDVTRRILFVLVMLLGIRLTAQIAVATVRFYMSRSVELQALPNTSIFENIIRVGVYIVGLLMVLQTVGISVIPVITALGVGGLAISLALQDTLANMFAGINMILARQIKIGDYVRLESAQEGFIEDIGWRNTVVRQMNNNIVIVPNSKMASIIITNCTLPLPEMSVVLEVGVSYGSDLAHVEQVTIDVARQVLQETQGGVKDFEPFTRYHTFGESGVNFSVILRVHTWVDQYLVKHEFYKRLHRRYGEEGIEIPFPQRVLHVDEHLLETLGRAANGNGTARKDKSAAKKPSATATEE